MTGSWRRIAATVVASVALVGGCTSAGSDPVGPSPSVGASGEPMSLVVMSFNIEYGGERVDFDSVAEAIEAAGADVVAIQEAYGNLSQIAADVGWDYYDTRTQVVSRYPLLNQADPEARAVFVEVAPGQVVAVADVHLSSTKYGPKLLAKGARRSEVMSNERAIRLPGLQPVLDEASSLMGQGIPVFVLGDFNAPSHRDWTRVTAGLRSHVTGRFRWPTSVAAERIGLVDSYRAVYPDPVLNPGFCTGSGYTAR